jgi:hypothetical protein
MHAFDGDLLIGGVSLRDLHGELEQQEQASDSRDWLLAGQMHVPPDQGKQLELERQYLLKLKDGREGLVELTRLWPGDGELLADFRPRTARPK